MLHSFILRHLQFSINSLSDFKLILQRMRQLFIALRIELFDVALYNVLNGL